MLASSANRYMTFQRPTSYVLDAAAAQASMAADRAMGGAGYLQVTVDGGTTGSGEVTLTGTDEDGNAQAEALTFAANGVQVTAARWGSWASLTSSGLADEATVPTVAVQAVSADGTPVQSYAAVATSWPVVYSPLGGADWRTVGGGAHELGRAYLDFDWSDTWTPQVGDRVVEGDGRVEAGAAEVWVVKAAEPRRVGSGVRPAHWRVLIERYDT